MNKSESGQEDMGELRRHGPMKVGGTKNEMELQNVREKKKEMKGE